MTDITTDERIERIINRSLELLQMRLEQTSASPIHPYTLVKETGEAMKALSEGVESYHHMAKTLKDDSTRAIISEKTMERALDLDLAERS
jgi:phosphoribosyl-dephospho-CoA transferase